MPGCAAVGCSNSAKKGFIMKKFPKNPIRREKWVIKMKRGKWKPTDYSCLCEVHFAPEMWENTRQDGSRKLKINAVPTIFAFTPPKKSREEPKVMQNTSLPKDETENPVEPQTYEAELTIEPQPSTSGVTQASSTILSEAMEVSQVEEADTSLTESDSPVNDVNIALHEKLKKYEQMYNKERFKTSKYKRQLRNTLAKLRKKTEIEAKTGQNALLKQLFNEDQVRVLKRRDDGKSLKFCKWSNETVAKALKLKFSCGESGYEELLKQNFPLPSVRTLQRRLQNLNFDCGILHEVFKFLETKVQTFSSNEMDCVLVLDEMAITPGTVYDSSLNKYFGKVTLPDHAEDATHVLVFMLAGITTRWKQVVAYHFTSDSVKGAIFKDVIKNIFEEAEKLHLNIISITSDMGACNQGLWKVWGISAGRHSEIKCKIPHPLHEGKFVYVFANVPHLFKNIKAMLISNKVIYIPDDIKEKYNLPSNQILSCHINEVVNHQESHCFKLVPKLTEEDLIQSRSQKMKVKVSTNVISHSVSSALKFLADSLNEPSYKTTAWFLDQVEKWFNLMTSQHPPCAISKMNPEVYIDSTEFLKTFMDLFQHMEVGYKKIWKPSQTGVLISTQSLLELQVELLENRGYDFILTSRFFEDCLENLFCSLRSKPIVPNALQVRRLFLENFFLI